MKNARQTKDHRPQTTDHREDLSVVRGPWSSSDGMTLIEVLIAFLVFSLLVASLVSLARTGLDTWTEGEARKDIYDRAQSILATVSEDLRSTYAENEWLNDGRNPYQPPAFIGDYDKNRRARLRLARTGRMSDLRVSPERTPDLRLAEVQYTDAWEVSYVMDQDAASNTLYRGVRYFDRRRSGSLFDDRTVDSTTGKSFRRHFEVLDDGVLHLEFRFWTQFTNTWSPRKQVMSRRRFSKGNSGPSFVWDSTRKEVRRFFLFRRRTRLEDADFVYPEVVQVRVTLETRAADVRVELDGLIETETKILPVSGTRGMPDPPDYVKIGKEWILYRDLTHNEIVVQRRGVRGTKPESHSAGDSVRFGRTFTAEVYIPVYREAVNP